MKNLLIALVALTSTTTFANTDSTCRLKLENDEIGRVRIKGYYDNFKIDLDNDFTQTILQALNDKGYVIDPSSNVELSFSLEQHKFSAKTWATLSWKKTNPNGEKVSIQEIEGIVGKALTLNVAYDAEWVDFNARQKRAVRKMLKNLPNCL